VTAVRQFPARSLPELVDEVQPEIEEDLADEIEDVGEIVAALQELGSAAIEIQVASGLRYCLIDHRDEEIGGFDSWCLNEHAAFCWNEPMPDHWAEAKARTGILTKYGTASDVLPSRFGRDYE